MSVSQQERADRSRVNRRRRPRRRRARGGERPTRVHAEEEEKALLVKVKAQVEA